MAMAETKAAQAHLRMLIAPAPWIPAAGVGVEVRWDGQKGSEGGEPARVQVQVVFYATQAATTGIATAKDVAHMYMGLCRVSRGLEEAQMPIVPEVAAVSAATK